MSETLSEKALAERIVQALHAYAEALKRDERDGERMVMIAEPQADYLLRLEAQYFESPY